MKTYCRPSLFVTFALLTACGQANTNTPPATDTSASAGSSTSIPIGIAFAQTSNVALLGQRGVAGAKIAKYFNHKGINGFKLVLQDTKQSTPSKL